LELLTERIFVVEKKHHEGQRLRVLRYGLFCDRTVHGGSFFYIKAHSQLWEGSVLVREAFETAGGLGRNRPQAMQVFARICEVRRPVLPEHLPEVIRDISYTVVSRRTRGQRSIGPGPAPVSRRKGRRARLDERAGRPRTGPPARGRVIYLPTAGRKPEGQPGVAAEAVATHPAPESPGSPGEP
jgi:hypothetical protein